VKTRKPVTAFTGPAGNCAAAGEACSLISAVPTWNRIISLSGPSRIGGIERRPSTSP